MAARSPAASTLLFNATLGFRVRFGRDLLEAAAAEQDSGPIDR